MKEELYRALMMTVIQLYSIRFCLSIGGYFGIYLFNVIIDLKLTNSCGIAWLGAELILNVFSLRVSLRHCHHIRNGLKWHVGQSPHAI